MRVVELKVQGLTWNETEKSLREKLGDFKHIVSAKPNIDFINNTCRG